MIVCEQLQATEYSEAIEHLMSDCRFHCHSCCYNVPLATLVFTLLFCLCVTLVPVIEQRLIELHAGPETRVHHTGLEFIHGIITWLFILAIYLVTSQLAKTKVPLQTSQLSTYQLCSQYVIPLQVIA